MRCALPGTPLNIARDGMRDTGSMPGRGVTTGHGNIRVYEVEATLLNTEGKIFKKKNLNSRVCRVLFWLTDRLGSCQKAD